MTAAHWEHVDGAPPIQLRLKRPAIEFEGHGFAELLGRAAADAVAVSERLGGETWTSGLPDVFMFLRFEQHAGVAFSPAHLAQFAAAGVAVGIDIYAMPDGAAPSA